MNIRELLSESSIEIGAELFSKDEALDKLVSLQNIQDKTALREEIRDIFKVYADKDNYPVYLHCSIGTDRTGLVSYLMGALLGIHYDDLYKDYLFSNFGNIGSSRDESAIIKYQNTLKGYKKKTLAECAEAYLLDIGLTSSEVASIRETMIEK